MDLSCLLAPARFPRALGLLVAALVFLALGCGDTGDGDGLGDDDDDDGVVCPDLGPALPATSPAPPGRGEASGAYDPDCGRVYLVLGDEAVPVECNFPPQESLGDGYVLDLETRTWHELAPSNAGPSPRARASAVWDPVQRRVLVFGGRTPAGDDFTNWNELWAFDPEDRAWTLLSAQDDSGGSDRPIGRTNAGLAIDEARGRMILHAGGFVTGGLRFRAFVDTWAWDLAAGGWTSIGRSGETPPGRLNHGFVILPESDKAYAFTGIPDSGFLAIWDTWVLDLATDAWSAIEGDAAGQDEVLARFKPGVVRDPSDPGRAILFGGHDNLALGNNNDLWSFDGNAERWRLENQGDVLDRGAGTGFCDFPGDFAAADLGSPERRSAHVFVAAGEHGIVAFGGATDCGKAQDTWLLDPTTLTWEEIVPSPSALAMTCARRGLPDGSCVGIDTEMCSD